MHRATKDRHNAVRTETCSLSMMTPCYLVGLLVAAGALSGLLLHHAATATPRRPLRTRIIPKFYSAAVCTDKKHFTNLSSYRILVNHADGREYIEAVWWLRRPIKEISKVAIVLHRCKGGISQNLCEYFATWNFDKYICTLLTTKKGVWSPLLQSIEPPFKCPIAAGRKVVKNGTMDWDSVEVLMSRSGLENIWRVELNFYDELRDLSICYYFIGELRRVRVKS